MLSRRSRGLAVALVAATLTMVGATAKVPDQPHKGIAPLCLLGAPPQECTEGPIS